jgi:hypothetical protein
MYISAISREQSSKVWDLKCHFMPFLPHFPKKRLNQRIYYNFVRNLGFNGVMHKNKWKWLFLFSCAEPRLLAEEDESFQTSHLISIDNILGPLFSQEHLPFC